MFYMLLQSIPLFHALFQSSSIHFRSDRLWVLQLLYAGLNLRDDAKIYKKNNILEHLLNFYSSSTSDPESRFLILEVNFLFAA
jgi:nucleolar pre-ribosomal-associated protein 1